jgi:hypothetical protein
MMPALPEQMHPATKTAANEEEWTNAFLMVISSFLFRIHLENIRPLAQFESA